MLRLSDPFSSSPSLSTAMSNRHDAQRPRGLWHAALTSTKGLFSQTQPSRPPTQFTPSTSRKRIHKSPSTPAFRQHSAKSLSRGDPSLEPARVPNLFSNPARAAATAASLARPIISSPSFPTHFDATDLLHPKLAFPLSPMPSPVGSTFSVRTSPSKSPFAKHSFEDDATVGARGDARPMRRRTKSAPGTKLGKRLNASLDNVCNSELEAKRDSAIVRHRCSDASTIPSPPPETPRLPSDTMLVHFYHPVIQDRSPRTHAAVKRKPVPLHLYSTSANHALSTPQVDSFGTPESASEPEASLNTCTSALYSPTQLALRQLIHASSRSDVVDSPSEQLLQSSVCDCSRLECCSFERKHGTRLDAKEVVMPNPWFEDDSMHSPQAEGRSSFSDSSVNSDARHSDRLPHSPPQTPPSANATDLRSSISIKIPEDATNARRSALSPLTNDEIRAIRDFIRNHEAGKHERRRRRKDDAVRSPTALKSRSIRSEPYDAHARIFDSYLERKDLPGPADSEDDGDLESCTSPFNAIATDGASELVSVSEPGLQDAKSPIHATASVDSEKDADLLPIGKSNRETFGYYDVPMFQSPIINQETRYVYAYAYIPESRELGLLPDDWRPITGNSGNSGSEQSISSMPAADNALGLVALADNSSRAIHASSVAPRPIPRRDEEGTLKASAHASLDTRQGPSAIAGTSRENDSEFGRLAYPTLVPHMQSMEGTTGIGLAILPPEQMALLTAHDFNVTQSVLDSSPQVAAAQSCQGVESELEALSISFDRMQTKLSKCEEQLDSDLAERSALINSIPTLKPALQIGSSDSTSTYSSSDAPSPTDTIAVYAPQVCHKVPHMCDETTSSKSSSSCVQHSSEDEATNLHSFIHLTPNAPTPKQGSRARLRKLFSLKSSNA